MSIAFVVDLGQELAPAAPVPIKVRGGDGQRDLVIASDRRHAPRTRAPSAKRGHATQQARLARASRRRSA
jgi:hypothetical protein